MVKPWHKKPHKNTSREDVVIYDELMDFERNNGDLASCWRVIGTRGFAHERLAVYKRFLDTVQTY